MKEEDLILKKAENNFPFDEVDYGVWIFPSEYLESMKLPLTEENRELMNEFLDEAAYELVRDFRYCSHCAVGYSGWSAFPVRIYGETLKNFLEEAGNE